MTEHASPCVNAARLANYVGRTVRLTCKVIKAQVDGVTVQASDGGEVQVKVMRDATINAVFIEVIGTVVDATTVKMLACINLGDELDMSLVNDVVELWHDPRFAKMV